MRYSDPILSLRSYIRKKRDQRNIKIQAARPRLVIGEPTDFRHVSHSGTSDFTGLLERSRPIGVQRINSANSATSRRVSLPSGLTIPTTSPNYEDVQMSPSMYGHLNTPVDGREMTSTTALVPSTSSYF